MMNTIRINKRKLRDEVICLIIAILGIIIFVCNMTKIVPGMDNAIEQLITAIVAYGFLIGPALAFGGLVCFWEVRNTRYPRKRTR